MRADQKENLVLVGKSLLLVIGGIVALAAIVELKVGGPSLRALAYLLVGLALALPPLVLAFRDAARSKRREP